MNQRRIAPVFALLCILAAGVAAVPAAAEPYYVHPRAMAMGAAYTAVSDDTAALEFNPAGLGQKEYLMIDAAYQRIETLLPTDEDKKDITDRYQIAVTDAKTSRYVAAGFSLTADGFPNTTFKENAEYQGLMGVAFPAPGGLYAFGFSAKYVRFDEDAPQVDAYNGDLGFILTASPWFHFGVSGRNLVPQKTRRILPSELAMGVSTQVLGFFTLAFDTTWGWEQEPAEQWNFHVGAEGLIAGVVAIRAGYLFDRYVDRDYYSAGLAYQNEMGSLGYTFRNNPEEPREFTHAIQVMVRF